MQLIFNIPLMLLKYYLLFLFQRAVTETQRGCFPSVISPLTSSLSSHSAPLPFPHCEIIQSCMWCNESVGTVNVGLGVCSWPDKPPCNIHYNACSAQSLPLLCQEIEMRSYPPYPIIHPWTYTQAHTPFCPLSLLWCPPLWLLVLAAHSCTRTYSVLCVLPLVPCKHHENHTDTETHTYIRAHAHAYHDQIIFIIS